MRRSHQRFTRVKVSATGLYTYPDVVIACGPREFDDSDVDTLLNPQVIIDVLSDSTESCDRGIKFRHYQQIESLKEYIVASRNVPAIERFVRQSQGDWLCTTFVNLEAELTLASVPAKVRLADIYAGITFPESSRPS